MPDRARFRRILDGGQRPVMERAVAYWLASRYSGSGQWLDLSGRGHHLTLGSAAGADTNDPLFLNHEGGKCLYLPGTEGNYPSAPDSAPLSITGDIDIRAAVALDDWTPTAKSCLVAKWTATGNQRAYMLSVDTDGTLVFEWSSTGTVSTLTRSSVAPSVTDGALLLVRVTLDVDNGAAGKDVRFYTKTSTPANAASDMVSNGGWAQLGDLVSTAVVTAIADTTATLNIGASDDGTLNLLAGKVYGVNIKNGIEGASAFTADVTTATEPYATFTDSSGNAATITVNRTATGRKVEFADRDLFLFGTDDYMEAADHPDLDFTAAQPFTIMVALRHYGTGNDGKQVFAKKVDQGSAAGYGAFLHLNGSDIVFRGHVGDGTTAVGTGTTIPVLASGTLATGVIQRYGSRLSSAIGTSKDDVAAVVGSMVNAEAFRIGRLSGAGTNHADFAVAGLGIWREALSPTDIETARKVLAA